MVRRGAQESRLLRWSDSIEIMEIMDTVRQQIGLKYPFES